LVREQVIASLADDLIVIAALIIAAALSYILWGDILIASLIAASAGGLAFIAYKATLAQVRPPVRGLTSMKGLIGEVVSGCSNSLMVRVGGELWSAECLTGCEGCEVGDKVVVEGLREVKLLVRPLRGRGR